MGLRFSLRLRATFNFLIKELEYNSKSKIPFDPLQGARGQNNKDEKKEFLPYQCTDFRSGFIERDEIECSAISIYDEWRSR
jgi:hypothetical protein